MSEEWLNDHRPGYFGRQRDAKVKALNETFGLNQWRLAWGMPARTTPTLFSLFALNTQPPVGYFGFEDACKLFYERSYYEFLKNRPKDIDFICSYGECIDNASSNVMSGCDYKVQESFSTHIQDIAVRNVLRLLGRKFTGPANKVLVIRSADSEGYRFGPGNIPFYWPQDIEAPSLCPDWAHDGSVEDFWQSNKFVQLRKKQS